MIRKLLTIIGIATLVSAQAQMNTVRVNHAGIPFTGFGTHAKQQMNMSSSPTTDTLYPASVQPTGCAPLPVGPYYFYPFDFVNPIDTGYIFGSNQYTQTSGGLTYTVQIKESAQKYNVTGVASVTGVLLPVGRAKSSSVGTMVTATIYSENTSTKAPLTSLGSSSGLSLSSMSTTSYNTFNFGTPVSVNNQNFFVSIVCPPLGGPTNDTLALLGTNAGTCSSTDSLSWIKQSINNGMITTWMSVNHYFRNVNLDLLIFPVISIPTGIGSVNRADLNLYAATPNPAGTRVNVNFSLSSASKVTIDVFDLSGKLVRNITKEANFAVGKHSVAIDLSDLEAGSYLYTIQAGGAKMASKFVVVK
jgi:hypothetical protein